MTYFLQIFSYLSNLLQLIISLEFHQPVKLHSLQLVASQNGTSENILTHTHTHARTHTHAHTHTCAHTRTRTHTHTHTFTTHRRNRNRSSTSLLVLKSILNTFSEVFDVLSSTWSLEVLVQIQSHDGRTQVLCLYKNILSTVHAMTKLFVPFCSAQDGESTDINCLVF